MEGRAPWRVSHRRVGGRHSGGGAQGRREGRILQWARRICAVPSLGPVRVGSGQRAVDRRRGGRRGGRAASTNMPARRLRAVKHYPPQLQTCHVERALAPAHPDWPCAAWRQSWPPRCLLLLIPRSALPAEAALPPPPPLSAVPLHVRSRLLDLHSVAALQPSCSYTWGIAMQASGRRERAARHPSSRVPPTPPRPSWGRMR
eukprot:scaffold165672_cov28-Tisochrysis_lutea.AAC.1